MKRALIGVADKTGIVEFARGLEENGYTIISTGGTASLLRDNGLTPLEVAEVTGFPEMMHGRLKTLHPLLHGGILMRRDDPEHTAAAETHGIEPIDIVCVNLYPFEATIHSPHTLGDAIENIDIGGPAMLRAAAKNHEYVAAITSPRQYEQVLAAISDTGGVGPRLRLELAITALAHTAGYDSLISRYLGAACGIEAWPVEIGLPMQLVQSLRYGENPHQRAALYRDPLQRGGLAGAKQLQGKDLSYCNLNDADTAVRLAAEFAQPAAVAVKHATPCGVAIADSVEAAYVKAHDADPVSIFGGIVAVNRVIDGSLAEKMCQIFLDVIIAPDFTAEARDVFAAKKNLRLLLCDGKVSGPVSAELDVRGVLGGYLIQTPDQLESDHSHWQVVCGEAPSPAQWEDLEFAWKVVKYVKSNAIVIASNGTTLGVGVGQTNRRDATLHALLGAGTRANGAVMASDAFFPMPDSVEFAAQAGIKLIAHPGGSQRDRESVAVAEANGVTMVITGHRHFRH